MQAAQKSQCFGREALEGFLQRHVLAQVGAGLYQFFGKGLFFARVHGQRGGGDPFQPARVVSQRFVGFVQAFAVNEQERVHGSAFGQGLGEA